MPSDRRHAWFIFCITFAAYAYFFQGPGWNQSSHFATMRSLAERGTADITPFANVTGDIRLSTNLTGDITVSSNGKIFSNKPPGVALLGVGPYWMLSKIERECGANLNDERVSRTNLSLMTILLASLPAAIINVITFFTFRRAGASARAALILTGAGAFGSLLWPYSGIMMSHVICTCLVFGAWYLLTADQIDRRSIVIAAILIGIAIVCDLLIAPLAIVMAIYLAARKIGWRKWLGFCAGPLAGAIVMLIYNRLAHGGALQSGPFQQQGMYAKEHLLFGQFGWPEWIRLYWITYHRMRGIFVCCPIYMICIFAIVMGLARRPFRARLDALAVGAMILIYIAFYLTFIGWPGGWGAGLRYMIPALALAWPFALTPYRRFPAVCWILIVLSIVNMLAITSVNGQYPGPISGPPNRTDPVHVAQVNFLGGQVNRGTQSHNLLSLLGVRGLWQITPIFALLMIYWIYTMKQPGKCNREGAEEKGGKVTR